MAVAQTSWCLWIQPLVNLTVSETWDGTQPKPGCCCVLGSCPDLLAGQPLVPDCITDYSNLYLDPFKLEVSQINDSLPCHHDNRKTLKPQCKSHWFFCAQLETAQQGPTRLRMPLFMAQVSSKLPPLSWRCNHLIVSGESANPVNRMHGTDCSSPWEQQGSSAWMVDWFCYCPVHWLS